MVRFFLVSAGEIAPDSPFFEVAVLPSLDFPIEGGLSDPWMMFFDRGEDLVVFKTSLPGDAFPCFAEALPVLWGLAMSTFLLAEPFLPESDVLVEGSWAPDVLPAAATFSLFPARPLPAATVVLD